MKNNANRLLESANALISYQWQNNPPHIFQYLIYQSQYRIYLDHDRQKLPCIPSRVYTYAVIQSVGDLVLKLGRNGFHEEPQTAAFLGLLTAHLSHWSTLAALTIPDLPRKGMTLSWIDQTKNEESRSGADFALLLKQEDGRYRFLIFQAKRTKSESVEPKIDISHVIEKVSNRTQYKTLCELDEFIRQKHETQDFIYYVAWHRPEHSNSDVGPNLPKAIPLREIEKRLKEGELLSSISLSAAEDFATLLVDGLLGPRSNSTGGGCGIILDDAGKKRMIEHMSNTAPSIALMQIDAAEVPSLYLFHQNEAAPPPDEDLPSYTDDGPR